MIVTSDSTAPMVMSMDTSTGMPPAPNRPLRVNEGGTLRPAETRPIRTNASTGMTIVPIAPSGSRRKILTSSQVSCQSPRRLVIGSVADRVAGELQEDILEVRVQRPELGDLDPVLGQGLDHLADELVAGAADGESRLLARD